MSPPTERAVDVLSPGEREVLRAIEERACRAGRKARYEFYRWAEAAGLWALRMKRQTRVEDTAA